MGKESVASGQTVASFLLLNFFLADGDGDHPLHVTWLSSRHLPQSSSTMNALTKTRAVAHILKSPRLSSITPVALRSYVSGAQDIDPQLADYPRLPWTSRQALPPKGWWDPQMRRNFGDTVCPSLAKVCLKSNQKLCLSITKTKISSVCGVRTLPHSLRTWPSAGSQ